MDVIKVSEKSPATVIAGSIVKAIRNEMRAEVLAPDARAVNQAIKGLALAVVDLRGEGINVGFVPEFADDLLNEKVELPIKLVIGPR